MYMRVLILIASLLCIFAASCGSAESQGEKSRTDIAPIQKRFSFIKVMRKVYWVGGAIDKTSGLPTPTDVYYRGFIWVSAEEASRLRAIAVDSSKAELKVLSEIPNDETFWKNGKIEEIHIVHSVKLSRVLMPKNAHGEIGFVDGYDIIYFDLKGR